MKLKGESIAFFDQPAVQCIGLSKFTFAFFFVMAMLTGTMWTGKYIFDKSGRVFEKFPVPVNIIQKQPQHDALFADVNSGIDLFALHPLTGVDEHVSAPTISTADLIAVTISEAPHLTVKGEDEIFVRSGDEVKTFVIHKAVHRILPSKYLLLDLQSV